MATSKITEKVIVDNLSDDAHILITQPEDTGTATTVESLRRVPLAKLAEKLGGGSVDVDATLTQSGKAADAAAVGARFDSLSEEIGDLSELETEDNTSLVAAINEAIKTGSGGSADLPENLAYLQDVTVDEASGDFIPMLSPDGTEYRLSIGDDGIPTIKNTSGTVVWTGTSGGSPGGDSGGGSSSDTDWVSGAEITYSVISDEYVSITDGSFIADPDGYDRTDYIYCHGAGFIYTHTETNSKYCAFYDINKQYVSSFSSNRYIVVPENAVYAVCSASSLDGAVIKLYKKVEPTWTDGEPYEFTFVENEYVYGANGIVAYNGWKRTDYVNCAGATKITKTNASASSQYGAFYNAEKEYMTAMKTPETTSGAADITVPTGACYFMTSDINANMDALVLVPYA